MGLNAEEKKNRMKTMKMKIIGMANRIINDLKEELQKLEENQ